MSRPPFAAPTDAEIAVVTAQLGRPARGVIGIAARCACGNPTVVATAPRLPDGTPFPTLYYLTHPAATAAWEYEMFMGHTAYVDGRLVLTSTHMSGDENKKPVREARMLSFAASP